MLQNISQHLSLEELSLQLQGLLVGQFQLSRQSFADKLEVICENIISVRRTSVTIHTYIVYCSGHFSKKAAKIFLNCTTVTPSLVALSPTMTRTYMHSLLGSDYTCTCT